MTPETDVERGRAIVERWRDLADQRLAYLTHLYETGRWPRYFSEQALLDNVREAKAAVAAWQVLVTREATPDNRPVDISWLGRGSGVSQSRPKPTPPSYADVPITPSFAAAVKRPAAPIEIETPRKTNAPAVLTIAPGAGAAASVSALTDNVFDIALAATAFPKLPTQRREAV